MPNGSSIFHPIHHQYLVKASKMSWSETSDILIYWWDLESFIKVSVCIFVCLFFLVGLNEKECLSMLIMTTNCFPELHVFVEPSVCRKTWIINCILFKSFSVAFYFTLVFLWKLFQEIYSIARWMTTRDYNSSFNIYP